MSKTIFITGASSGLGKATAKLFSLKGWTVIAAMRQPEKETELTQLPNIHLLKLDISNKKQIAEVAEQSLAILNQALAGEAEQSPQKLSPQTLDAWARVHGLAYLWLDQNIELSQIEFLESVKLILNTPSTH